MFNNIFLKDDSIITRTPVTVRSTEHLRRCFMTTKSNIWPRRISVEKLAEEVRRQQFTEQELFIMAYIVANPQLVFGTNLRQDVCVSVEFGKEFQESYDQRVIELMLEATCEQEAFRGLYTLRTAFFEWLEPFQFAESAALFAQTADVSAAMESLCKQGYLHEVREHVFRINDPLWSILESCRKE